jgi:hypothetical protein
VLCSNPTMHKVALMDDRYVSNTVFDGRNLHIFSINILAVCEVA